MLSNHAKLLELIQATQGVEGRKKLQKMIYIAKKCGLPFQEKYELHMYGPYSEELTCRIEELCELGFLQEINEKRSNYQIFSYQTTEEGIQFAQKLNQQEIQDFKWGSLLKERSSRFLELVATLLYFDEFEKQEQIQKVQVVKNKLNFMEEEFEEAFLFLEQFKATLLKK